MAVTSRREFLRAGGMLAGQALVGSSLFTLGCALSFFGPLRAPDENGIRLPHGFRSRVLDDIQKYFPGYRATIAPEKRCRRKSSRH